MDERDYYAEVRAILEDWIEAEGIDRDSMFEEISDVIYNLTFEEA